MADFTGFYFNHIHSSTYNIYRTSNGSRFEEGLIPDFEDYSVSVAGGRGELYQGRKFKSIPFKIPIAFDHLTERNLRELRNWLVPDQLLPLQFDERPYKTYFVKLSSRPTLSYVCFLEEEETEGYSGGPTEFEPEFDGFSKNPPDWSEQEPHHPISFTTSPISHGNKRRIYKGEGELSFIAYDPMGFCADDSHKMDIKRGLQFTSGVNWQSLSSYTPFKDLNGYVTEWGSVSGLYPDIKIKDRNINKMMRGDDEGDNAVFYIPLYNPGDEETDFQLYFDLRNGFNRGAAADIIQLGIEKGQLIQYWPLDELIPVDIWEYTLDESTKFIFSLKDLYGYDHILLDSRKRSLLVHPSLSGRELPDSRYDLIKTTHWPKIPKGESRLKIVIPKSCLGDKPKIDIKYDYLYY